MNFILREATDKDMAQVLELIKQLAVFEKEGKAVEITVDDLIKDGFGEKKRFHCFVAESAKTIVGMALVYERYSTWKGPVIHLEDLIVREGIRGNGIGSALLTEVVKYGHQLGVKRICWEVLDWNETAIAFYESRGAKVMRDWDVVQLDEKGIQSFIADL